MEQGYLVTSQTWNPIPSLPTIWDLRYPQVTTLLVPFGLLICKASCGSYQRFLCPGSPDVYFCFQEAIPAAHSRSAAFEFSSCRQLLSDQPVESFKSTTVNKSNNFLTVGVKGWVTVCLIYCKSSGITWICEKAKNPPPLILHGVD